MENQPQTFRSVATLANFNFGGAGIELAANKGVFRLPARARTIAVTSGKGGVGKTNIAVNLAAALAARRQRVSLMDADLGLANANVLFGLNPQWHIGHVLTGQRSLPDITVATSCGVRLIPGGSGNVDLANLSNSQIRQLVAEMRAVEGESDFIIVDTAAGIGANVTGVLAAAGEAIVVTTPDPASVIDAYAIIKVLHQQSPVGSIWIVINNAFDLAEAEQAYRQLYAAAARFLDRKVAHLGTIPYDRQLSRAVREQIPVIEGFPEAVSSQAFHLIAKYLDQSSFRTAQTTDVQSFWNLLTHRSA